MKAIREFSQLQGLSRELRKELVMIFQTRN
jgi:hypothetical protein